MEDSETQFISLKYSTKFRKWQKLKYTDFSNRLREGTHPRVLGEAHWKEKNLNCLEDKVAYRHSNKHNKL